MVTLYDQYGQPAKPSSLGREQAVGSIGSVRSPYEALVAPGLTPRKLQHLLQRATEGDHHDYLQLASEIEKRDPNYFMALQTRKLAVQALGITVAAPSEDGEDTKVAEAVKSVVESDPFRSAILDILDATSKGFSVTEICWARSEELWMPVGFKHRPQRWFFFERDQLEELRLEDGTFEGQRLEPFKFIEHRPHVFSGVPLAGGLARVVAAYHVFKGYAVKNWMTFAEVFGIPLRVGRYDQGASEADKEQLKLAVTNIGSDAAATIPKTMDIEFLRANASGNAGSDDFFRVLSTWLNREVNKCVLGSNLVDEDGGSFAKAQTLDMLRTDLLDSDARQLAATVQRCLVRPFVDLNFGARRQASEYPKFGFDIEEPEDLESRAKQLTALAALGVEIPTQWVHDTFGIPMPIGDEPVLKAPAPKPTSDEGEPGDDGDDEEQDAEDDASDDEQASNARARAAKMSALVAQVEDLAGRSTNMRTFRRQLRELALLER